LINLKRLLLEQSEAPFAKLDPHLGFEGLPELEIAINFLSAVVVQIASINKPTDNWATINNYMSLIRPILRAHVLIPKTCVKKELPSIYLDFVD